MFPQIRRDIEAFDASREGASNRTIIAMSDHVSLQHSLLVVSVAAKITLKLPLTGHVTFHVRIALLCVRLITLDEFKSFVRRLLRLSYTYSFRFDSFRLSSRADLVRGLFFHYVLGSDINGR